MTEQVTHEKYITKAEAADLADADGNVAVTVTAKRMRNNGSVFFKDEKTMLHYTQIPAHVRAAQVEVDTAACEAAKAADEKKQPAQDDKQVKTSETK